MDKHEKILEILSDYIKEPKCELNFSSTFELMVAVILSAQCTDKRVNLITKELFDKFGTLQLLASASQEEIENIIKSCGFFRNKAKNIINASRKIVSDFQGCVPANLEDLSSLPGIGRKTANVILSVGFNDDAIAVDTHVFRVSNRLGIAKSKNVSDCERILMKKYDKKDWTKLHSLLVLFGRYTCEAKNPKCEECPLKNLCDYYMEKKYVS